jgi:hypothetical protein
MFQMYMLQVFRMDVAKIDRDVAYVASVLEVCCKLLFKMFHLFHTYVATVLSRCCICCTGYTHVASMLQMFHLFQASVSCCKYSKCRPPALVSRRAARPGRDHQLKRRRRLHRRCEEVQGARRRCGRGPRDSSAEYDAMDVIDARCFRTGIEPGARASHPSSVWQSHVHAQNNACTCGA